MPEQSGQNTGEGLIPQPHGGALAPPFPPGVSGNPGGRPARKPLTDAYAKLGDFSPEELDAYEPRTVWEARAKQMHQNEHILAAKEIADRVEGKSKETVEHQGGISVGALIEQASSRANGSDAEAPE